MPASGVPREAVPKPKPLAQPWVAPVAVCTRVSAVPVPKLLVVPPVPDDAPIVHCATRCWLSNIHDHSFRGDASVNVASCQVEPSAAVARRSRMPSVIDVTACPFKRASMVFPDSWRGAKASGPVMASRTWAAVP